VLKAYERWVNGCSARIPVQTQSFQESLSSSIYERALQSAELPLGWGVLSAETLFREVRRAEALSVAQFLNAFPSSLSLLSGARTHYLNASACSCTRRHHQALHTRQLPLTSTLSRALTPSITSIAFPPTFLLQKVDVSKEARPDQRGDQHNMFLKMSSSQGLSSRIKHNGWPGWHRSDPRRRFCPHLR